MCLWIFLLICLNKLWMTAGRRCSQCRSCMFEARKQCNLVFGYCARHLVRRNEKGILSVGGYRNLPTLHESGSWNSRDPNFRPVISELNWTGLLFEIASSIISRCRSTSAVSLRGSLWQEPGLSLAWPASLVIRSFVSRHERTWIELTFKCATPGVLLLSGMCLLIFWIGLAHD